MFYPYLSTLSNWRTFKQVKASLIKLLNVVSASSSSRNQGASSYIWQVAEVSSQRVTISPSGQRSKKSSQTFIPNFLKSHHQAAKWYHGKIQRQKLILTYSAFSAHSTLKIMKVQRRTITTAYMVWSTRKRWKYLQIHTGWQTGGNRWGSLKMLDSVHSVPIFSRSFHSSLI